MMITTYHLISAVSPDLDPDASFRPDVQPIPEPGESDPADNLTGHVGWSQAWVLIREAYAEAFPELNPRRPLRAPQEAHFREIEYTGLQRGGGFFYDTQ